MNGILRFAPHNLWYNKLIRLNLAGRLDIEIVTWIERFYRSFDLLDFACLVGEVFYQQMISSQCRTQVIENECAASRRDTNA